MPPQSFATIRDIAFCPVPSVAVTTVVPQRAGRLAPPKRAVNPPALPVIVPAR